MSNYTTGDMDLKLKLSSEREVTIDFVVREASAMWKLMRSRKLKFGDQHAAEALMSEMQKTHPEFCKSYPIVNRYICQMQEYDAKAFKLWLMKIKERPWKTEGEYLDAQADYVVMLYRAKKPRANMTEVNNLRRNIRNMLQVEHDKFKHYAEEYEREVTAEESMLKDRNMDELHAFAKLAGEAGLSKAETLRVETDLAAGEMVDIDSIVGCCETDTRQAEITADDLLS